MTKAYTTIQLYNTDLVMLQDFQLLIQIKDNLDRTLVYGRHMNFKNNAKSPQHYCQDIWNLLKC